MRFVTKFLIMLLLVFYLSFCSFGVGVAYADDAVVGVGPFPALEYVRNSVTTSITYPNSFNIYDSWINNPVYAFYTSLLEQLGCSRCYNSNGNFVLTDNDVIKNFSLPFSFSRTGLDLQDLSFEFPLISYFVYSDPVGNSYVRLTPVFVGTATVTFSDGSTKTISLNSSSAISFSAKKDNRTNEYLLSSEDFNLTAENAALLSEKSSLTSKSASLVSKNVDYTSRNAVNSSTSVSLSTKVAMLSTDYASLSAEGKASFSSGDGSANFRFGQLNSRSGNSNISASGLSNSISASSAGVSTTGSITTANNVVNSNSAVSGAIRSFSLSSVSFFLNYASLTSFSLSDVTTSFATMAVSAGDLVLSAATLSFTNGDFSFSSGTLYSTGNFFGQDGELSANAGELGVADASFSADDSEFSIAEQGVINSAPVTLDKASDDVHVTGFSITGNLNFPTFSLRPSGSVNLRDNVSSPVSCFCINLFCSFGESESIVAHIAATLDDIYYTLRFDLPLAIRHLIIPTTQEVSDVIEEAVEEVKNNAGGLGQAVSSVEEDIKRFQNALVSGVASPLKIPAGIVNVNNTSYTLWEEFDVAPYFQLEPIQDMTSFLVPFLEFLVGSAVMYHLYYMWISLLSGSSYFGFLKGIQTLYDAGDDD